MPCFFGPAESAQAETRSLKIYFVHTGERDDIVFKRNGRYVPEGLKKLNVILRDWRRNEPTRMDPRLFDLVWEVYQRANASGYINVVSGYRSPATNAMLRSRSAGVAKESQHMRGTAMDFYIPGVSLSLLRQIGMKAQAGGVGYYPNSGSPFVHMDVGGVRSWPRMPRQDLVRLFPDGKTMHIPADGKPLPGYEQALAEYKQRVKSGGGAVMMADSKSSPRGRSRNLLTMLFGGGDEDEEEDVAPAPSRPTRLPQTNQQVLTAAAPPPPPQPAQQQLTAPPPPEMVASAAPVPLSRPAFASNENTSLAAALYSPGRNNAAEDALTKVTAPAPDGKESYPDLAAMQIPVPTLLGKRGMKGDAEPNTLTASVDPGAAGFYVEQDVTVPVPIGRPTVAEALLASADVEEADDEAEASMSSDDVGRMILSPEAAKALEDGNQPEAAPTAAAASQVASANPLPAERPQTAATVAPPAEIALPANAPVPHQAVASAAPANAQPHPAEAARSAAPPTEVAMLTPPRPLERPDFGDVFEQSKQFDQPKQEAGGITAGIPEKGKRPGRIDAETAHRAVSGAPVLTRNMLSSWALNRDRGDTTQKMGKAPRVATHALTSAPAGAYAVGFNAAPRPIDQGRFGPPQAIAP